MSTGFSYIMNSGARISAYRCRRAQASTRPPPKVRNFNLLLSIAKGSSLFGAAAL